MTLAEQANSITIRQLVHTDAEALRAVRVEGATFHPEAFHSAPEEMDTPLDMAVSRITMNAVFGAFDGETLVGTAMLACTARVGIKQDHIAEVWSVYVRKPYRGCGLARTLVARVISEARLRSYEALVLSVASPNAHVRTFYESLGFVTYGREPRTIKLPDGRYIDNDLMMLDLT